MSRRTIGLCVLLFSAALILVCLFILIPLKPTATLAEHKVTLGLSVTLISGCGVLIGLNLMTSRQFTTAFGQVTNLSSKTKVTAGEGPAAVYLTLLVTFEQESGDGVEVLDLQQEVAGQGMGFSQRQIEGYLADYRGMYTSPQAIQFEVAYSWLSGYRILSYTAQD